MVYASPLKIFFYASSSTFYLFFSRWPIMVLYKDCILKVHSLILIRTGGGGAIIIFCQKLRVLLNLHPIDLRPVCKLEFVCCSPLEKDWSVLSVPVKFCWCRVISISKHFVKAYLGLDLIIKQSVNAFTKYGPIRNLGLSL